MNASVFEEMNASANHSVSETYYCPKPRWHFREINSYQQEVDGEILDINVSEDSFNNDQSPYFCGSPPSRVSNPIVQDTRFRDDNATPVMSPTSTSTSRKAGVRQNFGNNPAVRIEGFECDHRNRSISTLA